jgi:hypothetical protein
MKRHLIGRGVANTPTDGVLGLRGRDTEDGP